MKKRGDGLRRALWWIMLAAFVLSGAWVGTYVYQAYAGSQAMREMAGELSPLRAAQAALEERAPEATPGCVPQATPDAFSAQYQQMARRNPDMAGWIYIAGTQVDYPVMHTPDEPQKYLHRGFDGKYAFAGLPFLDAACSPDAQSANRIVYAHNMRSGQMFAALKGYMDEAFLAAHPAIGFDTLTARGQFEVIAVLELRATSRTQPAMRCYRALDTTDEGAVRAFNAYLETYAGVLRADVRVGDDILTLSTCEIAGGDERLVVVARALLERPS